ncbi:Homeobox-leucine zipper protein REVOLUTA [Camellia lanceoleosa]|uniref:Homeobox-leucine zipper protein REVOLUTA n=1 Tax=Camellia lanceoleosa TaxID=1840588 RepID=A0ACC0F0N6_9ERIC|nr:Homeobox-leucine zipper protein REVOLUTA [Camellia lanceoleosa]
MMFYLRLKNSLIHGGRGTCESFCDPNDDNDYDNGDFDFGPSDFDMPENAYEYEEVPLQVEKHDNGSVCFETNEHEDPSSQASLEDLSRSHLVYERSMSGSGATPNAVATAQFVRAKMLPSGYFIWPCKGGGSVIHKVDMLVWISCQAS